MPYSSQSAAGFAFAMLSMVLFGVYMAPRRHTSMSLSAFLFWMGFGILIGSTIIGLAMAGIPKMTAAQYAMIFGGGVVWATGTLGYTSAVQYIGLSRATPIKNTTAILGTLYGIAIFHEFSLHNELPLALVLAGSVSVVAAASLLGRVTAPENGSDSQLGAGEFSCGVGCAIWAALAYSVYTIPMKIVFKQGMSPAAFVFIMGQGCFVGMAVIALITKRGNGDSRSNLRDIGLSTLAGIIWTVASICANIGVKLAGVAITWPVSNLNTVVAVAYGIWVLKEANIEKHKYDLRYGLLLATLGVVLLALSMS